MCAFTYVNYACSPYTITICPYVVMLLAGLLYMHKILHVLYHMQYSDIDSDDGDDKCK
jgi:hypothetical protein